jgi:putative membrane protein
MTAVALVLAALAALIHVYIFWLEAFAWTAPRGLATFGMTGDQARATKELAFNQGFYNLFLAVVTVAGVVTTVVGHAGVGAALIIAGCGSMVAAGLVLWTSSPSKARAALVQLTAPALALIALGIAALT